MFLSFSLRFSQADTPLHPWEVAPQIVPRSLALMADAALVWAGQTAVIGTESETARCLGWVLVGVQ